MSGTETADQRDQWRQEGSSRNIRDQRWQEGTADNGGRRVAGSSRNIRRVAAGMSGTETADQRDQWRQEGSSRNIRTNGGRREQQTTVAGG